MKTGYITIFADGWVGVLHQEPPTPSPSYPVAGFIEILEVDGEYVAELTIVNENQTEKETS